MSRKRKPVSTSLPAPLPIADAPPIAEDPPAIAAEPPPPDLAYIAEALRPLAVPVGSIDLDPANARTHDGPNLSALRGSLRTYGQRKPIVVNRRTGTAEAGNGSLTVARELGWTHIAAVFVDDDPATAAGFSIADNRTAELAGWNDEALAKLLPELDRECAELAAMIEAMQKEHVPAEPAGDEEEPASAYAEQYGVIVLCRDAAAQEATYNALLELGYDCKVVST